MLTGATSLDLVKDELFASMAGVEDLLQQFLEERQNGSLLQQAIEGLQQLRGTLNLIELDGAALLAEEMIALATDIPEHEGEGRNAPLSALCNGLFLLQRYLHLCRQQGVEQPELLLPTINDLRAHRADAPPLAESHFYPLDVQRLPVALRDGSKEPLDTRTFARLRQMYQLGLLGMLRDERPAVGISLMQRALQRMETRLDDRTATLCWVASASLEAMDAVPLQLTAERKRLYSRLDRELKRLASGHSASDSASLLRAMLYLVALGDAGCVLCEEVRRAVNLPDPGYSEATLQRAFDRLQGPGADVMRSVAEALHEEIAAVKDLLDLLARNAGDAEQSLETLDTALQRLWKTLDMLDLAEISGKIRHAAQQLSGWQSGNSGVLEQVADAVLHAELTVNRLENEGEALGGFDESRNPGPVELKEAHIVLVEESQAGLALARRAITAYIESGNDRMHLLNVPATLETVRGGLIFLGMTRASDIIGNASRFIRESMLEQQATPDPQQLEVLADALTSIEFYLESAERSSVGTGDVLAVAEDSLAELGYGVGA
ncbi:ferrous iron transporter B [Halopseudomonas sp. SMJS2]|uniref:ferrous iron transporter B n=1 Tax=Halopseudomonas sp. SMJS2 TaxID=3041098 RepID=UPI002452EE96|nr:ferrous iron transporter B [Halopseudomonas sp. SMJS2]WGK63034.1 ferrous iron transporter B [Halopseudomonas sp. SMJS2]